MNKSFLDRTLKKNPKWEQLNIKKYVVDDLYIDDNGSQVRQGDIKVSHVKELQESILASGLGMPRVPITIGQRETTGEHVGKFKVLEGNHRLQAMLNLRDETDPATVGKFTKIKAWETSFKTDEALEDYQLQCNEHDAAVSSTKGDYSYVLRARLKKGSTSLPDGLDWENVTKVSDSYKILVSWVEKQWSKSNKSAKTIVKKALDDHEDAKIKNYSNPRAVKAFSDSNNMGWVGKKTKEECGGLYAYFISQASHVFPNLAGNTFHIKTQNTRNKAVAIFWENNTWGKNAKDIQDFRIKALSNVNKAVSSPLVRSDYDLVDHVVFLPQLKSELSNGLIYTKKQKNGEFTL